MVLEGGGWFWRGEGGFRGGRIVLEGEGWF